MRNVGLLWVGLIVLLIALGLQPEWTWAEAALLCFALFACSWLPVRAEQQQRLRLAKELGLQDGQASWNQLRTALEALTIERDSLAVRHAARLQVLQHLPMPLLMLDARLFVVRANHAFHELFGAAKAEVPVASLIRDPVLLNALERVWQTKKATTVEYAHKGRQEYRFHCQIQPMPQKTGGKTALVVVFADVTAAWQSARSDADFVAYASHELRTPLTAILGFIETLRGPAKDDPAAQAHFLEIMDEQSQRMARLIQDLLSLSRLERKKHIPPEDYITLQPMIEKMAQTLEWQAQKKNMRFQLDLPEAPVTVIGDADELNELLQNLMDNALKYGRPDTAVAVSLSCTATTCSFLVKNQGDGIAPEDIPRLTERFYRTQSARTRSDSGTGLGLSIVENIIDRHGGRLKIDSVLGAETQFQAILPLAEAL